MYKNYVSPEKHKRDTFKETGGMHQSILLLVKIVNIKYFKS